MRFNKLEEDILNWFLKSIDHPILKRQLSEAYFVKREYTGVGFFISIDVPKNTPILHEQDVYPIPGPEIDSAQLEFGAGTVLFITDGKADTLEIFSYGDHFPEKVDIYRLISPGKR